MVSKIFTLIAAAVICSFKSFSQQACSKTPYNCKANLINTLYDSDDVKIITGISYAKSGVDSTNGPADVAYKEQCSNEQACSYTGDVLKYDVYYPIPHNYKLCPLPVIFIFHPGNYSDCSANISTGRYCRLFAQRGFIAVNLEYRRGASEDPSHKISASKLIAVYKASQDLKGAIRSVIARQLNGSSPQFKIDTANIFLGDAGTTPLNIAYITSQKAINESAPGLKAVLGPVDANYYYGSANIQFTVKGIFNQSGGLLAGAAVDVPQLIFQQGLNPVPALIAFHGEKDKLIFPDVRYQFFSTSNQYKKEAYCLNNKTYTVPETKYPEADLVFYGSRYLYNTLTAKGVPCELYLDSKMGHDLSTTTGFGTGITDVDSVQTYIVQRVATFFQSVISKKAKNLKTTVFKDCENYRQGCNMADDNNDCAKDSLHKNIQQATALPNIFSVTQVNRLLYLTLNKAAAAQAEIYNAKGNFIKSVRLTDRQTMLDLSNQSTGMIIIKVTQANTAQSKKIFLY